MFFGTILYQVMMNWVSLTRGAAALMGIPSPNPIHLGSLLSINFEDRIYYYYLVLIFVLLMVWLIQEILRSRVGDAFLAIREDEISARVLGIDTFKYKVLAFTLSSFYAGIAGAFYAHSEGLIAPHMFSVHESVTPYVMMIIGGLGNIPGGVLGSIVMTIAPEYLRSMAEYRMVIYGALVVIIVVFMPGGLGKGGSQVLHFFRNLFAGGPKVEDH
jgi:branched-chain amino acid transport system permease protein